MKYDFTELHRDTDRNNTYVTKLREIITTNQWSLHDLLQFWQQNYREGRDHDDWYYYFFYIWIAMQPQTPAEDELRTLLSNVSFYYSEQAGYEAVRQVQRLAGARK